MAGTIGMGSFAKVIRLDTANGPLAVKQFNSERDQSEFISIHKRRMLLEYTILSNFNNLGGKHFPVTESFNRESVEYSMTYYENNLETFMETLNKDKGKNYQLNIAKKIIDAFVFIEEQDVYENLLHCDIKPCNVLIHHDSKNDSEVMVAISDFGICTYDGIGDDLKLDYSKFNVNSPYTHNKIHKGVAPSKETEIYSVLRTINYVIMNQMEYTNFDDEIWRRYNDGEIADFKELSTLFKVYYDRESNNHSDKEIDFLELLEEENIEPFFAKMAQDDSLKNSFVDYILNTGGDLPFKIVNKLIENYRKIFWYNHYHEVAGILFNVILSVRFTNELKMLCFDELVYISRHANSFFAKKYILKIINSKDEVEINSAVFEYANQYFQNQTSVGLD